jgi:hypothetical protein
MNWLITYMMSLMFSANGIRVNHIPHYRNSHGLQITIPSIQPDSLTTIIPFTRAGNLIVVKGKADSTEGNFILDTGAPNLVLNITYFREYTSTRSDEEQSGVTGSGPQVVKTMIREFDLGRMNYSKMDADLISLGHIENSKGIKILGLLGVELFRQCEMIIDFENMLIYLHRIGKKESNTYRSAFLSDTSSYSMIPLELMDNRIVITSFMGGRKLKFIMDSGAESNLLDSRLPDKIMDNVIITGRVLLTGSGNKKVEALYGDFQNLEIGNQKISTLPVVVANLEKTCVSYNGCVDGMLGFDFLALHKIGFNFVTRKMYLWR